MLFINIKNIFARKNKQMSPEQGTEQGSTDKTTEKRLDGSIDPTELIVQEGPDVGRIADVELAQIGADAEEQARQRDKDMLIEYPSHISNCESEGTQAMALEVGERAINKLSRATPSIKDKLNATAIQSFTQISNQKESEGNTYDNDKARAMIDEFKSKSNS